MLWFKSRYVLSLEMEISRLRLLLEREKEHSDRLVERLLLKNEVPIIPLPPEATKEAMARHIDDGAGGLFDDVEESKDRTSEHEDNRKENQFDPFLT